MSRKFQLFAAAYLMAFVFVISARAQDYKALAGKWHMTSETDGDPVNWSLTLKDVDGKLTGSIVADAGEMPAFPPPLPKLR